MAKKKPSDVNTTAFQILQAVTGQPTDTPTKKKPAEPEKNPAAYQRDLQKKIKGR